MSMLTGDDFKRGFKYGRDDALNDKDRWNLSSVFAQGWSLKFAIHGNIALDTFAKGYDEGYSEGLIEKSVIRKVEVVSNITEQKTNLKSINNNQKSNNMNSQNYEHQLQSLQNLLSFLGQFKEDLRLRMSQYNDQVSNLRQSGLEVHIADNYDQNFCIPTQQAIWKIIEDFQNRDIPFVNNNIAAVVDAWEKAKKTY